MELLRWRLEEVRTGVTTFSLWGSRGGQGAPFERAVAAFFVYTRALRGRLPRTMHELDDEL